LVVYFDRKPYYWEKHLITGLFLSKQKEKVINNVRFAGKIQVDQCQQKTCDYRTNGEGLGLDLEIDNDKG